MVISHGGTECGQGINTKAAQVAAFILGIPLDLVSVKASNNVIGANAITTGGSVTSDIVCLVIMMAIFEGIKRGLYLFHFISQAVKGACEVLNERLRPVREQLPSTATWPMITEAAHNRIIPLSTVYTGTQNDITNYYIYGFACTEIEVDILTGSIQLARVDILEDTGQSISPLVDVGQV